MRGDAGWPLRVRYTKHGRVRFVGHRDVARAFERALRVVELPLRFSEGFNPHPKVSFGLALPVGCESDGEYLDLSLKESVDLDGLAFRLSEALPPGIDVTGVAPLADRAPSLQESVTAVEWRVAVGRRDGDSCEPDVVQDLVDRALAVAELPTMRHRKGREVVEDVKPSIRTVQVRSEDLPESARVMVEMHTETNPRSAKPTEILAAFAEAVPGGPELVVERALRTHQWIERDGARLEPLVADQRPHVPEVCAS